MTSNRFDTDAVLRQVATVITLLPDEVRAIQARLEALATATRPPVWGYAGMLLLLAQDGDIGDVFDVYATIKEWVENPKLANTLFDDWQREGAS